MVWWRFNANGFFWGMFAGTAGALIFSEFFSGVQFLYFFPVLFLMSLADVSSEHTQRLRQRQKH
jgi:hypothetical protein